VSPADPRPPQRIKDPDTVKRFRLEHLGEPCEYCERRPGTDPHHRVFRSQGGNDEPANLMWLCRVCHDAAHGIRSFA
jgi:5-methylcytosine-specific restriction endonuclease McrA